MQLSMSRGWNTWDRASAANHVHLPTGFGLRLGVVLPDSNGSVLTWDYVDKCVEETSCRVRPGAHAYNGSLTEITYRIPGSTNGSRLPFNVTVTSAHVGGRADNVVLLLRANTTEFGSAGHPLVHISPSYFFTSCTENAVTGGASVCGDFTSTASGYTVIPAGFPAMTVVVVGAVPAMGPQSMQVAFDASGIVCLASGGAALPKIDSTTACAALVAAAIRAQDAELAARYPRATVGSDRDLVEAMRSVIGWNCMFDMRTHVITPVSRNFGSLPFALWLWDTYFSTLLAAEDSRELAWVAMATWLHRAVLASALHPFAPLHSGLHTLQTRNITFPPSRVAPPLPTKMRVDLNRSYSNLLAITRPTVFGDVPGYRTATEVATDRSKPFVGPMVLMAHYRRFQDKWIVRLLFDDMMICETLACRLLCQLVDLLLPSPTDLPARTPMPAFVFSSACWSWNLDIVCRFQALIWLPRRAYLRHHMALVSCAPSGMMSVARVASKLLTGTASPPPGIPSLSLPHVRPPAR